MSQATLKNHPLITSLCGGALLLLLAVSLGVFTQAQSKKDQKPVNLSDAVERVGPNQVRAKPGFKLIIEGDGWVVEQSNGARRLEKRVKCGACPGGNCRSRLNGTCAPRNSCTSSSCFIDPF